MVNEKTENEPLASYEILLRGWKYWIIPVLLFISATGWSQSFIREPPYDIPISWLRISQVVGILSSLLLGVWWLGIFRGGTLWGRASFGMLGIGIAVSILNSITDQIPYLVFISIALQVAWIVIVWIGIRTDPNLQIRISVIRQLNTVRSRIFGRPYLWMIRTVQFGTGFLFFAGMTGLGWVWILLIRTEMYLVWIFAGFWVLISMSFGLLGLIVGHNRLDHRLLCSPLPAKTVLRKIFVSEMIPSNLFLILCLFWVLPLCSAWRLGWIIVGALIVLYQVYLLIVFQIVMHAVSRPTFPDVLRDLRELYVSHFDEIQSILPVPKVYDSVENQEGIQVDEIAGRIHYPWASIRHIYILHKWIITLVLEQGKRVKVRLSGRSNSMRFENLLRLWGDGMFSNAPLEFDFPRFLQILKMKENRIMPWVYLVEGLVVILCMGMVYFFPDSSTGTNLFERSFFYGVAIFAILGGSCLLIEGYSNIKNPHRVLDKIRIVDKRLNFCFADGSTIECSEDDILKHHYSTSQSCSLSLKNDLIIHDIDKVSYFGVLKKRLDAMIAQQEQGKSVEERT